MGIKAKHGQAHDCTFEHSMPYFAPPQVDDTWSKLLAPNILYEENLVF